MAMSVQTKRALELIALAVVVRTIDKDVPHFQGYYQHWFGTLTSAEQKLIRDFEGMVRQAFRNVHDGFAHGS